MKMKKNIEGSKKRETAVCFGGGSGITKYLINELKKDFRIIAATSMVDNGMSTGQLRADLGVLPPGDIMKQLAVLSSAPEWKIKLWRKRFGREEFKAGHYGHTFGNLFLAGIQNITGSFQKALRETEIFLEMKEHRAYPATIDNVQLCAELENGQIIEGEDEIDEPEKHDPNLRIKKVFLKPPAKAFRPLLAEIRNAKIVTFGPGDFYSSVIPCLLPEGISSALRKSKAKKIFIANTVTELGETNGFTIEKYISEIEKYLGCLLDFVIVQSPLVSEASIREWQKKHPNVIGAVERETDLDLEKFIKADIMVSGEAMDYDPKKIRKVIFQIYKKSINSTGKKKKARLMRKQKK